MADACPICGARCDPRFRPFCARRCAEIDLGRWITGQYVVAGTDATDDEAAPAQDADPA